MGITPTNSAWGQNPPKNRFRRPQSRKSCWLAGHVLGCLWVRSGAGFREGEALAGGMAQASLPAPRGLKKFQLGYPGWGQNAPVQQRSMGQKSRSNGRIRCWYNMITLKIDCCKRSLRSRFCISYGGSECWMVRFLMLRALDAPIQWLHLVTRICPDVNNLSRVECLPGTHWDTFLLSYFLE